MTEREHGNYKSGDQITRAQALSDFFANFARPEWRTRPLHVLKALFVDLARIIGVADRDRSQLVGMVLMISSGIAALALASTYFDI